MTKNITIKNQLTFSNIIAQSGLKSSFFERGEVIKAFSAETNIRDILEAAVVSLAGGTLKEQAKLSFALHMMRTFGDEDGLFLDLIES